MMLVLLTFRFLRILPSSASPLAVKAKPAGLIFNVNYIRKKIFELRIYDGSGKHTAMSLREVE